METLDRKRKTRFPCPVCRLNKSVCICSHIHPFTTQTRVTLIIHHRETRRTTNTGMLATHLLSNSEVIVRGKKDEAVDLRETLDSRYAPVMLYPSECAQELNSQFLAQLHRPIQLLVPDGNWRQASKVHYRHSEIGTIPRVFIRQIDELKALRKEHKENGMATMESIAYAMEQLEGKNARDEILKVYQLKVAATLKARGTPFIQD